MYDLDNILPVSIRDPDLRPPRDCDANVPARAARKSAATIGHEAHDEPRCLPDYGRARENHTRRRRSDCHASTLAAVQFLEGFVRPRIPTQSLCLRRDDFQQTSNVTDAKQMKAFLADVFNPCAGSMRVRVALTRPWLRRRRKLVQRSRDHFRLDESIAGGPPSRLRGG